ncbi:hypothetical protein [Deinococcus cellulosilyticus]|uniref:Uncharacterized protein n=1 Tax=Deinococcus cellulosilyticus (strain DSM 18568 / NBRC 106333 / KACC 11606 / 5516J-15) TaxID=1223518 RepID=A0A511MXZ9_DEIC1|nr:hypothetical protein [Deinococcus cellulosilyticus]GEM45464.1 hypothetical protein DC3_10990 [Deinococcus cellulosilyticus NBRC 106333 = KACC 11606]
MTAVKVLSFPQKLRQHLGYLPTVVLASVWVFQPLLVFWAWTNLTHATGFYPGLSASSLLCPLTSLAFTVTTWRKRGFHWTFLLYPVPLVGGLGFLYLNLR